MKAKEEAGYSQFELAEKLAKEARAKGITTTVVGIGAEAGHDTPFLRRLAAGRLVPRVEGGLREIRAEHGEYRERDAEHRPVRTPRRDLPAPAEPREQQHR